MQTDYIVLLTVQPDNQVICLMSGLGSHPLNATYTLELNRQPASSSDSESSLET